MSETIHDRDQILIDGYLNGQFYSLRGQITAFDTNCSTASLSCTWLLQHTVSGLMITDTLNLVNTECAHWLWCVAREPVTYCLTNH